MLRLPFAIFNYGSKDKLDASCSAFSNGVGKTQLTNNEADECYKLALCYPYAIDSNSFFFFYMEMLFD